MLKSHHWTTLSLLMSQCLIQHKVSNTEAVRLGVISMCLLAWLFRGDATSSHLISSEGGGWPWSTAASAAWLRVAGAERGQMVATLRGSRDTGCEWHAVTASCSIGPWASTICSIYCRNGNRYRKTKPTRSILSVLHKHILAITYTKS